MRHSASVNAASDGSAGDVLLVLLLLVFVVFVAGVAGVAGVAVFSFVVGCDVFVAGFCTSVAGVAAPSVRSSRSYTSAWVEMGIAAIASTMYSPIMWFFITAVYHSCKPIVCSIYYC